jgi:hypothetical protein
MQLGQVPVPIGEMGDRRGVMELPHRVVVSNMAADTNPQVLETMFREIGPCRVQWRK